MDEQNTTPGSSIHPAEPQSNVQEPAPAGPTPQIGGVKKSRGPLKVLLLVVIVLILMAGAAYGGYKWENNRATKVEKDYLSQIDAKNGQIVDLQKQVAAKSTTSTSSSTTNPYAGWKSYTLPTEKLSFKYPSAWSLTHSATSSSTGDSIVLTGTNNFTMFITTGTQDFSCPAGGCNVQFADPVTFLGSTAYLDSYSGQKTGPILETELSKSSSTVGLSDFFATKNIKSTNSTITVSMNYSGTKQSPEVTKTLSFIKSDSNYKDAKLVIQSMTY